MLKRMVVPLVPITKGCYKDWCVESLEQANTVFRNYLNCDVMDRLHTPYYEVDIHFCFTEDSKFMRRDLDNLVKFALDNLKMHTFVGDDNAITQITARKIVDKVSRTVINLEGVSSRNGLRYSPVKRL